MNPDTVVLQMDRLLCADRVLILKVAKERDHHRKKQKNKIFVAGTSRGTSQESPIASEISREKLNKNYEIIMAVINCCSLGPLFLLYKSLSFEASPWSLLHET
jgi:hypothetical protein